ncbi:NlpC/P60 domain [Bifidobacterium sp. DSM 109958]|uniref:NlpC/P60 domain n=1 Tax=Bifidobacterium moraviense TaxID=2675323 RepID=A0A7Y0F2W2_9BIFI|nr:C40 family peptidase [Bifidobacterium sp. DSM 109958]NMN00077.1 NlpC/P60 domain [Bifidobacterium sp. DSM 109958]
MYSMTASCIALTMMAAGTVTVANATDGDDAVVTSARSFPKLNATRVDLLVESASIAVDDSAAWGGVESLDVPQTKSQAELDAEAQAAADAAKAEEEARQQAEAQREAASRSNSRRSASASTGTSATTSGSASSSADSAGGDAAVQETVSGNGAAVISYAMQFIGVPYVIGGSTPSGWDCSGFTSYVFRHFGVSLSRTSGGQAGNGVSVSDPQPGDLVIAPGHVGIYIGGGKMVHAPRPGRTTAVDPISYFNVTDFRRVI